jgi:hypothetical protein
MTHLGDYRLEPPDICDRDESEDCPKCERGYIDLLDITDTGLLTYDEMVAENYTSQHVKCSLCDGTGTVWPEPVEYEREWDEN